jgi:hypothetical protein
MNFREPLDLGGAGEIREYSLKVQSSGGAGP